MQNHFLCFPHFVCIIKTNKDELRSLLLNQCQPHCIFKSYGKSWLVDNLYYIWKLCISDCLVWLKYKWLFLSVLVHKIVRVAVIRSLTVGATLGKAPSEPTPPGKDTNSGASSTGNGGGKKNTLTCPKCGDPCTHVETFVCKWIILEWFSAWDN